MKHKKLLLTLFAVVLAGSMSFAQLSVGISTGYHMGAFQSGVGPDVVVATNGDMTTTNIYYSLGGGVPINIILGIPIMDNVSFDLGFTYWLGSNTTVAMVDDKFTPGTMEVTTKSNQMRVMPGITVGSGAGLYGKVGLVVPIGGKTTFESIETTPAGNIEASGITTGLFSLGAFSAIGYAIEIGDGMHLFAEIQALSLNIQGATKVVEEYSDPLGNTASDFPKAGLETEYVDELNASSNTTSNPNFDVNKPIDELAGIASFGAWGINIGFTITIGN